MRGKLPWVLRFVAGFEPAQFGVAFCCIVPHEPGIGCGAAAAAIGVFHVEGDALAEDPNAGGWRCQEN